MLTWLDFVKISQFYAGVILVQQETKMCRYGLAQLLN